MSAIVSIFALIVIIFVLVFVHELGHFIAARLSGVHVKEFAVGFGKAIWQRKYGSTLYRINVFPLGGYVSLEGEDGEVNASPSNFQNKSWGARVFVLLAGVTMNIFLAFALFASYLFFTNYQTEITSFTNYDFVGVEKQEVYLVVNNVQEDGVASGVLEPGDVIKAFEGETVDTNQEFLDMLAANKGEKVHFTILRFDGENDVKGEELKKGISLPKQKNEEGQLLGISFYTGVYKLTYPASVLSAIPHTWNIFVYQLQALADSVQVSVDTGDPSAVTQNVGSVVAVGAVVDMLVESGEFLQLINLTALVSISLAFVNILPLPILDGGVIVITTIEELLGRKLPKKLVEVLNSVFFVILIILFVLIVFKDLLQFNII